LVNIAPPLERLPKPATGKSTPSPVFFILQKLDTAIKKIFRKLFLAK